MWTYEQICGLMGRLVDGQMMDGLMNGWMSKWMNEWMGM